MVEVKLKGLLKNTKVVFYSSIKDMPNRRYQEFIKMAMRDIGIGSTLEDFNGHFAKVHAYLMNGKSGDAMREMNNVYMNFFNCINRIGIWSYCLAPFVCSVDGKQYTGTEIEEHRELLNELSDKGLTVGQCEEILFEVKKKLLSNWPITSLVDIQMKEMKTSLEK